MPAWVTVTFDAEPDETEDDLVRLSGELAADLREVGVVRYVPAAADAAAKGAGEVVAATLAVLTAAEPDYVRALVDTVTAFLRRHEGRRAELEVGQIRLTIDRPTAGEVAGLIDLTRSAIERAAGRHGEP
jgi:hypothetical protein